MPDSFRITVKQHVLPRPTLEAEPYTSAPCLIQTCDASFARARDLYRHTSPNGIIGVLAADPLAR